MLLTTVHNFKEPQPCMQAAVQTTRSTCTCCIGTEALRCCMLILATSEACHGGKKAFDVSSSPSQTAISLPSPTVQSGCIEVAAFPFLFQWNSRGRHQPCRKLDLRSKTNTRSFPSKRAPAGRWHVQQTPQNARGCVFPRRGRGKQLQDGNRRKPC